MHAVASIRATTQQLIAFDIGDGWGKFGPPTKLASRVEVYFPAVFPEYAKARQQLGDLYLPLRLSVFHAALLPPHLDGLSSFNSLHHCKLSLNILSY